MKINKRTILLMTVCMGMLIAFSTPLSYAAYAVTLKNGRTIYIEAYWIEGNWVNLQFKAGIMKLRKDEIHSITKIKGKIPDEEESPTLPEPKSEAKPVDKPTVATKEEKPSAPESRKDEIEALRKKKREIQTRLDEAKKAHSEAKTKGEKEKTWKEMISISREMNQFYQEVVEKNKGTVPQWWNED